MQVHWVEGIGRGPRLAVGAVFCWLAGVLASGVVALHVSHKVYDLITGQHPRPIAYRVTLFTLPDSCWTVDATVVVEGQDVSSRRAGCGDADVAFSSMRIYQQADIALTAGAVVAVEFEGSGRAGTFVGAEHALLTAVAPTATLGVWGTPFPDADPVSDMSVAEQLGLNASVASCATARPERRSATMAT